MYKNFTDSKVRQYLVDVQNWLYFIRYHKKPDCSIPILDHTGKPYTGSNKLDITGYRRLACYANAKKLHEIQSLKQKQPISVPTDTSKTSKTDKPTTSQTAKSTTKSQPIPISQTLATAIQKDTTTIPTNTTLTQYPNYIS